LGTKLDPSPWWTVDASLRHKLPAGPAYAKRLVHEAAAAAVRLRELPLPPAAHVDAVRRKASVPAALIDGVLATPRIVTDEDERNDEPGAAYAVGVSLVRPTLAQLPTAQNDTTTMNPSGHLDHGWAVELVASTGAMVLIPTDGSAVDFFAPGVSVSAGFSYRWGSLLPGRRGRSLAEINLGVSQLLHVNAFGAAGGNTHVTLLDQEVRWPVVWEALTTYNKPLNLAAMHRAGRVLFFNGLRAHELVRGNDVSFLGIELETAAVALSEGSGTHPLYFLSPELRFFVGLANPQAAQPSFSRQLAPTFGVTLTGGYTTFL
jgi:hypothetical protein